MRLLGGLPGAPLRALGLAALSPSVRRVVRVDLSVALLTTVFACLTGPFTGVILRRDLGATPFQLSVLASAGAAFMLLSLLWARAVESRSPLPFVVWTGFAGRALFLLVPLVTGAWALVAILVGVNLMITVAGPANTALVERIYPREERGRAMGFVRVAAAVPGIVLVVGAGRLLSRIDYHWVFPVAAVIGMAASLRQLALPVMAVREEPRATRPALTDAWRTVRGDARFRRLLLSSFVFGSAIWLQMPAQPLLMADVLHVTTAQLGIFSAVAAVAGMLGNGLWGRLGDRWPAPRTLRAVYLVGIVAPLVACVATSPWVLLLTFATESVMTAGLDIVWTLAVIDAAGRRRTAQYAAIAATLAGVRGVLGPLAGAALIQWKSLHAVYLVAAALMLGAAWLAGRGAEEREGNPVAAVARVGG